ncbi:DNA polymerase-3 subunit alpha [Candidatus Kryptonium thompsonii]|uniref:DNA polymerase III subunit alpha n=1 Tax=Candidatus Kryptonium thompsonii TaxID=1633631 RepID=UPI000707818E|nr:DNA polymerase III subunit alpha [Candidatus Kryptonium thompsoni]CUS88029.1 DNA polymerase-3 subunit alpha [Candidatus Kryptonium thompsoni]CUS97320.1 DNA polymerase-3 subunit alpha [Candidatus Kryptonium thompsoni]CUT07584.1 DNA polymerase-3 subunit alpha [Candidatus Kryptonium thompsoni]
MPEFVHLHNHSHYSILDAISTIDGIIESAVQNKMSAVALTDHGVLFGALEFYIKAKEAGIKPIIGSEVYIVTDGSRFDKTRGSKDEESDLAVRHKKTHYKHLVLLAKDSTGLKNLSKLISIGHTEGFYYKPRIDFEVLEKYHEGLIALSACIGGVVSAYLVDGDYEGAKKMAMKFKNLFGDDFYLEIQNHFIDKEQPVLQGMPRLAKELGIKLVATNDCHYLKQEHAIPHNIFISIQDKNSVKDIYQLKYGTDQVYFKNSEEMYQAFKDFPEAIESTLEIAEKCNLEIELGKNYLPHFPIPKDAGVETPDEYLEKLAFEGLQKRYKTITKEIEDRLRYELDVIKKMGFSTYFLIVHDFIHQAKKMGVAVGPGRGSAAGSIVSYALGITNIDPLKYGLLFERFLNPERVSMPDIDVDFADDKRELVIDYVKKKYGEKSVAQIITFGTLSSRAVIRDVARVLGISLQTVDSITKNIPVHQGKPLPLSEALETPELEWLKNTTDPKLKELVRYALILEGLNRHPSTHAAGIVIAPGDISDYVPLYQTPQTELMTQYDKDYLEKAGLLKVDILGLRTLTVIVNTLKLIKQNYRIEINIDEIPLDDKETYNLLGEGKTVGVFQFESSGMQEYLRRLKPTNIHDLAVMNALYRPGPMEMIDEYIERKHGRKPVEYLHPKLEPILKETFGIIVYQEQVMQIANQIAGFSLAKADLMRRAMGKKDKELMAKQRDEFIQGALKNGIDRKIAEEIFDMLEKFASYGFNKSHAVAYAYLAYQTAYLKAHYPAEFMAATMSSELNNTDKIVQFIEECRRMGIKVLPPDINESNLDFTIIDKKTIRFGLGAIKNVGENAVNEIISVRNKSGKFKNLFDFCARVDLRVVNKRAIESLIQAGAFDSLNCGHRAQLLQAVEIAMNYGERVKRDRRNGQVQLFDFYNDGEAEEGNYPPLPDVKPWNEMEKFSYERNVLGFYVSGHPLMKYFDEVQTFSTVKFGELDTIEDGSIVRACGVITDTKTKLDKNKNQMLIFELEDFTGKVECVAFNEVYKNYSRHLFIEGLVMVVGEARRQGNSLRIIAKEIYPIEEVKEKFTYKIVALADKNESPEKVKHLAEVIKKCEEGNCLIEIDVKENEVILQKFEIPYILVKPTSDLINSLREIFGEKNVKLIPK